MKIEKIMLAIPNTEWSDLRKIVDFPYATGLLTAVLKDRYDVKILDANFHSLTMEQTKKEIEKYQPDVFGVSCRTFLNAKDYDELISNAKEVCPNSITIAGGTHATVTKEDMMKNKDLDYVVMGEGEERLPKLLGSLEKNRQLDIDGVCYRDSNAIKIINIKSYVHDLDELPFPNYDNINIKDYMYNPDKYSPFGLPRELPYVASTTSRGCPFHCLFCSTRSTNGKEIRYRSSESVLKEIDWLVEKYGVKEISYLDDNLFLDKARAKKIIKGITERNYDFKWNCSSLGVYTIDVDMIEPLKQSGFYQLSLAVESGTYEGLKKMNKPYAKKILETIKPIVKEAKRLSMETLGMWVIGTPGETWEEIRKTFELAEELDLDYNSFNIATPLPETQLYELAKRKNYLREGFSFSPESFFGFGVGNIITEEFIPEELQILRAFEWDRINFKTPEKIKKIYTICRVNEKELNDWRKKTRRNLGIIKKY